MEFIRVVVSYLFEITGLKSTNYFNHIYQSNHYASILNWLRRIKYQTNEQNKCNTYRRGV
jgi:hypothetical protein